MTLNMDERDFGNCCRPRGSSVSSGGDFGGVQGLDVAEFDIFVWAEVTMVCGQRPVSTLSFSHAKLHSVVQITTHP
eukprot:1994331-Rhodomonas_salina.2